MLYLKAKIFGLIAGSSLINDHTVYLRREVLFFELPRKRRNFFFNPINALATHETIGRILQPRERSLKIQ